MFHALVALKSVGFDGNRRLSVLPHLAHMRVDELIESFVTGKGSENIRLHCRSDPEPESSAALLDHDQHHCHINFGGLSWILPVGHSSECFWDFAKAVRISRPAYLHFRALKICSWASKSCFHKSSIHMLEWLQKKALSEVRTKVMLTIGTNSVKLPRELIDQILGYAIEVEEIPTNPLVKETILVDPPEDMSPEVKAQRGITGPRPFTKTIATYKCPCIKDGEPDDVFAPVPAHVRDQIRAMAYGYRGF